MNIKILSFNIHKGIGRGFYRSSINQIQNEIHLLQPDIVFLQEVCGHQFDFLGPSVWLHHSYGKNAVYENGHHGNAILSKFPITKSDNHNISMHRYERRGLLHAVAMLPNEEPVHYLCVHLGLLERDRRKQLRIILDYVKENIPCKDRLILAGDFNDWSGYATQPLINELALEEAFLAHEKAYATTWPSWMPVLRLDRIYFRGFKVNHAERLMQKPWRYLSDHIGLCITLGIT